jgi:hypothetical protein
VKTSRNAACPCGSGKKFKRCCGRTAAVRFTEEDAQNAQWKFREFFTAPRWDERFLEAFHAFWACAAEGVSRNDLAVLAQRSVIGTHLSRYTMLDYVSSKGGTILDAFLRQRDSELSAGERAFLELLSRSRAGVYEIRAQRAGRVDLQDIWLEQHVGWVEEGGRVPREASVGDVLVLRLVEDPAGRPMCSCTALHLATSPDAVLGELQARMLELQLDGLVLSRAAFLKLSPPVLAGLWLDEHGTELPCAEIARPALRGPKPYPHTEVKLSSALDEEGGLLRLSEEERRLVHHWGQIAYAVSSSTATGEVEVDVWCRRRPEKRACEARLRARFEGKSESITWRCPACHDSGTLTEWRGTTFDSRAALASELREAGAARADLRLNTAELRNLCKLSPLPPRPLALLVGAWRTAIGGGTLEGPVPVFEELTAALEGHVREQLGRSTVGALLKLHRRLSAAANRRPYRLPAGVRCSLDNLEPEGLEASTPRAPCPGSLPR